MVEISTERRNRTGRRQEAGSLRSTSRSRSSRRRKRPGPAGSSFSRISASQEWLRSRRSSIQAMLRLGPILAGLVLPLAFCLVAQALPPEPRLDLLVAVLAAIGAVYPGAALAGGRRGVFVLE